MQIKLDGKVALITGANTGIGKATAIRLAKEGCDIVLFGGRNTQKLLETKNEILSLGVKCLDINGDITKEETINEGINTVIKEFGKVDILINNAGSAFSCPFEDVTTKQFDEIMNLDVKVPFFLTQKLLPYIKQSNHATVINIASVVGHVGYALQSAYSTAKHAVIGFSKSLAREVYKDGVRVHVISPGGVYTDMVKLTRPDLTGDNMIMPEDVADTIAFLLTNRNNAVIDEILLHRINKEPFSV